MKNDKLAIQYKEIVSAYIEKGDEHSLYEVSRFARACLVQNLGPEILVEMHSSILSELVEGKDSEVREFVARANQVLLEAMMTFGFVYQELLERKSGEYKALEAYIKKIEKQAEQLETLYNELEISNAGTVALYKELDEKNKQLQETDRLKSIFLASMSHELRTPLNSIIGFTSIILMGMVGEVTKEQSRQLTIVKKNANHLLELINDLLDISKIEAGRVELSLEEFEIADIVGEVIEAFSPAANEKGLELLTNVPEGIMLYSDERRIKQVIMNLVSNAVKFTEQGSVKIAARVLEGEKLELSVIDSGIGIKEEDFVKLFAPFQQIEDSLAKRYEGTGLGLYLTKKLVDLLGGEIRAKSEYGRGSEFTFVLALK